LAAGPNVNGAERLGNSKALLGGAKSINGTLVPSHKSKHKKSAKKVASNNLGTLSSASTAAVNGVPTHQSPMLNGHYGVPSSSQAVYKAEKQ